MSDWREFFGRLAGCEGQTIGTTDWFVLDQPATDIYAALIADLDPMHNDPTWQGVAQWGGTIVVGTHGLCLLPALLEQHGFPTTRRTEVEFQPLRLHRVRFIASLNVGKRARDRAVLRQLTVEGDSAWRVTTEHTFEREGEEKPFMSAVLECAYRLPGGAHLTITPQLQLLPGGRSSNDRRGGAHLKMTPQLQQDIRLLQLSTLELQMEVQQALESSLILEIELLGGDPGRVDAAYMEALRALRGETLGVTPWLSVNRTEADAFRIVVGGEKNFGPPGVARTELHPFHLLALITGLGARLGLPIESDEHFMVLNYGFDDVSFGKPVHAGDRFRMRTALLDITDKGAGRHLLRRRNTLEAWGEPEPILVAISLSYWVLS